MSSVTEIAKRLYGRFEVFIKYSLYGIITSALNFGIFFVGTNLWAPDLPLFGLQRWQIVNACAWLVANLYSFFANRYLVFHSKKGAMELIREVPLFFGTRLISFFIATYAMTFLINRFSADYQLAKLIGITLEVIINYFSCKFLVFKSLRENT